MIRTLQDYAGQTAARLNRIWPREEQPRAAYTWGKAAWARERKRAARSLRAGSSFRRRCLAQERRTDRRSAWLLSPGSKPDPIENQRGLFYPAAAGPSVSYPEDIEEQLLEAVKGLRRERLNELLTVFTKRAAEGARSLSSMDRLDEVRFAYVRLTMQCISYAQSLGVCSIRFEAARGTLLAQIIRLPNQDDLGAWLMDTVLHPVLDVLASKSDSRRQQLTSQMIRMVHEEFDTDLSIEICARRLHYNANYLSSVFKKAAHISFTGYLAGYRHRAAKYWLKVSGMTVKQIAERLRYNNSQNFIRSFRKQEGMTPGQYKQSGDTR
ncbi:helix-turn-helix transcriptional regulator [Paenibacillus sp. y28]|uniref:helix-turn-helix transcriptional regulator n=1 Tax=Paenibacillus sp. y28 TaxID=3129110 RepID=UPI0030181BFB